MQRLGVVRMFEVGYPYKRLNVPAYLGLKNGELPADSLKKLSCGGTGWFSVDHCGGFVFAMNVMYDHAKKDGVILRAVSEGYRSLARQEALFYERYSTVSTGRVPEIIRIYKNQRWFLKKGYAPSAIPQTSPHGYGLAQDLDVRDPNVFLWLRKNAPKYGIYLESPPSYLNSGKNPYYEPWHWQLSDPANPTRRVRRLWRKYSALFS